MEFKSGKRQGKTTEEVLLKEPDFAEMCIAEYPDAPHSRAFARLVTRFDEKAYVKKCRCKKLATRASAYFGSASLMFWCDECDPYAAGAIDGKLRQIETLEEGLDHINWTARGNRALKRSLVRSLAEAKGLPKRVGRLQAMEFFK